MPLASADAAGGTTASRSTMGPISVVYGDWPVPPRPSSEGVTLCVEHGNRGRLTKPSRRHVVDSDVTLTRMRGSAWVSEENERRCSPIHGKSAMKRGRRLAYSVGYLWTTESRLCAQRSDQGRATSARHRGEYSWKRRCPAAAAARARDRGRTSGSRRLESDPPRLGSPSLSKRGRCHGRL